MLGLLRAIFSGMAIPKPAGPARQIATIATETELISADAMWIDQAIVVRAKGRDTVRILEFPLDRVEQCRLGLRFQMSSSEVSVGAWPEMWVKVDGFGEAFSKGLNYRLKGTNGWTTCELPFFLKKNEPATLLKLNVAFKGAGSILMKDIELFSTPLEG